MTTYDIALYLNVLALALALAGFGFGVRALWLLHRLEKMQSR